MSDWTAYGHVRIGFQDFTVIRLDGSAVSHTCFKYLRRYRSGSIRKSFASEHSPQPPVPSQSMMMSSPPEEEDLGDDEDAYDLLPLVP